MNADTPCNRHRRRGPLPRSTDYARLLLRRAQLALAALAVPVAVAVGIAATGTQPDAGVATDGRCADDLRRRVRDRLPHASRPEHWPGPRRSPTSCPRPARTSTPGMDCWPGWAPSPAAGRCSGDRGDLAAPARRAGSAGLVGRLGPGRTALERPPAVSGAAGRPARGSARAVLGTWTVLPSITSGVAVVRFGGPSRTSPSTTGPRARMRAVRSSGARSSAARTSRRRTSARVGGSRSSSPATSVTRPGHEQQHAARGDQQAVGQLGVRHRRSVTASGDRLRRPHPFAAGQPQPEQRAGQQDQQRPPDPDRRPERDQGDDLDHEVQQHERHTRSNARRAARCSRDRRHNSVSLCDRRC